MAGKSGSSNSGLATFEYSVRDSTGQVVRGRIEARDKTAVASRLREMNLTPLVVNEVSTSGLQTEINIPGLSGRIDLKDLAIMSRQMATMVSAGLSLLRTLTILAEQTDNKALAKILAQVRGDVEVGSSLSTSFAKHDTVFPPIMINIVRAGEVGGFLEKSLLSVANNFESEVKLRAKIKSAMTYPVVVLFIAIAAVIGMLLFIVPVFENMFDGLGGELPAPTQFLVLLSGWMKWLAPLLLVLGIAFSIWWNKNKNAESVRSKVDPWKLKLPVFGKLFTKVAIARFTRNFSTMLGAGVPILQALDIVGQTAGNYVIEDALKDVARAVKTGQSIGDPMSRHDVFPPMVTQMVAVGEDAGALEVMLEKVSEFYDDEVESTTEQLTALLEPLMIVFLGGIVGGMIIALYMPIFKIFDLMG